MHCLITFLLSFFDFLVLHSTGLSFFGNTWIFFVPSFVFFCSVVESLHFCVLFSSGLISFFSPHDLSSSTSSCFFSPLLFSQSTEIRLFFFVFVLGSSFLLFAVSSVSFFLVVEPLHSCLLFSSRSIFLFSPFVFLRDTVIRFPFSAKF